MNSFSYGAGLLGSLAYIRMLGSSIDSMAGGAGGLIKYVFLPPFLEDMKIYEMMAQCVYIAEVVVASVC